MTNNKNNRKRVNKTSNKVNLTNNTTEVKNEVGEVSEIINSNKKSLETKDVPKAKKVVEAKKYDSNKSLLDSIKGLLTDKGFDFKNSNIELVDSFIDDNKDIILKLTGGLKNRDSENNSWSIYLKDLKELCDTLTNSDSNIRVWVVQLENNHLSDEFTVYLGIKLITD